MKMEERSFQDIFYLANEFLEGSDYPSETQVFKIMDVIAHFNLETQWNVLDKDTQVKFIKLIKHLLLWNLRHFPLPPGMAKLERENRKLRKVLNAYQTSLHSSTQSSFQCIHCPKKFIDEETLQSHIDKRHPADTIEQGLVRDTPLTHKIAQLTAETRVDGDYFDRLAEEIMSLRSKILETEKILEDERNARASLEQDLLKKIAEVRESIFTSSAVTVTSDSSHQTLSHLETVLYQQLDHVSRIGKDVQSLNEKIDAQTTKATEQRKHIPNILELLESKLQELGISPSSSGINEKTFKEVIFKLHGKQLDENIPEIEEQTTPNGVADKTLRKPGILKIREDSKDGSGKNDRRISFSDKRIEISPETTDDEMVISDNHINENEDGGVATNPFVVPKPKPRLSKETRI